jgi:hypothetical protein
MAITEESTQQDTEISHEDIHYLFIELLFSDKSYETEVCTFDFTCDNFPIKRTRFKLFKDTDCNLIAYRSGSPANVSTQTEAFRRLGGTICYY